LFILFCSNFIINFILDTSENISGEEKMNGHETSSREKFDNKSDESDEENPIIQPGNGRDKEEQINLTNGKNNTEQELNEQAAMAAAAAISGDSNKPITTTNESDATSRRKLKSFLFHNNKLYFRYSSSTNG